MKEITKVALLGSIKKWQAIAAGTGVDNGPYNCPLCQLFGGGFCRECPVALKVKAGACMKTPYVAWNVHLNEKHQVHGGPARCRICIAIAKKEVAFLKQILDERSKAEHAPSTKSTKGSQGTHLNRSERRNT